MRGMSALATVTALTMAACTDPSGPLRLSVVRARASAGPAFGSKIAFPSDRDEPNVSAEIYVVNADGTGLINLTNHASDDTRPDWSPDGTLIAFQSNRHGNPEIYVMHADGSDGTNPRRLTVSPGPDAAPDWSPDGLRIAFQSSRNGNAEIYVMNADGTLPTRLTNFAGADAKPSWSPNGKMIAFHREVASFLETHNQLFTMNADGSGVTTISTPTPFAFNGFPSWAQGHAVASQP